jgi:hypothetical protein
MPLFMDVHRNIPDDADAAALAGDHRADVQVQERFGAHYRKYWFDPAARTVFCLVDAPDAASATAVHQAAHGMVADEIYCVEEG